MPKKKKGVPAVASGTADAKDAATASTLGAEAAAHEPKDSDVLANGDEGDEGDEAEQSKGNRREGADISRVTDYVEQKELDSTKASQAVAAIVGDTDKRDRKAELQREHELAAVEIRQEDVALICSEMELDKEVAERKLREHKGSIVQTLNTLVNV
uniref:Nascent polypeptide-associated complex subunit alpha-like UBA domain-containing protein n=1 Tax=Calcidiscus leptoporus TaxID=127549 RepID=A0A7S0NZ77_9EUKA|mmetsp:Transcript_41889/g.98160  ORF Transcript_41889/g.98160 Transcript_41889/m.98160 type:complete len:156 (+) Transcript_41889:80-547(+)|eukprot:CAMPEP_0119379862 /NCGR_PEP_ID=MMETSP1334-20130426/54386_1 /TAXON_ID=127549 /ORGANISM="Calcidiscus leptoporus, Strain RCC1130" /LENGTH=155 /DNA_ID=CAMNT_0007399495 /DNA_START=65 /DNA_END=532 /DNA_ORIENTATION=+